MLILLSPYPSQPVRCYLTILYHTCLYLSNPATPIYGHCHLSPTLTYPSLPHYLIPYLPDAPLFILHLTFYPLCTYHTAMANGLPGAPPKLDNGMITAFSLCLSSGMYLEPACHLCNVSPKVVYEWLHIADQDELVGADANLSIYIRFRDAINKASASNESQLVGVIKSAAVDKKEWLPAITFLERRHPDRWGRKDRTRIEIDEHKTVTITHVEYRLPSQDSQRLSSPAVEGEARELPPGKVD